MTVESAKDMLMQKAIHKHPGKTLTYCGSKQNWDDCFTINNDQLILWYNVEGNTHVEALTLN
jgi:hypothetical protein